MNKLINAPLIDIEYRVWWHITNPDDLKRSQYILGDFYALIKEEFPNRSIIKETPPVAYNYIQDYPTHSFLPKEGEFPQIQMSNRLMILNTNDIDYEWKEFKEMAIRNSEKMLKALNELLTPDHYHLELLYVDFIEFDFRENNIIPYLKENLNTNLEINYSKEDRLDSLGLNLAFKTKYGKKSIAISEGGYKGNGGIIIRTLTESNKVKPNLNDFENWLEKAHDDCSKTFKEITKGKLFNSFK